MITYELGGVCQRGQTNLLVTVRDDTYIYIGEIFDMAWRLLIDRQLSIS